MWVLRGRAFLTGKSKGGDRERQEQKTHSALASCFWMMPREDMTFGATVTSREVQEPMQKHNSVNSWNRPYSSPPLDLMVHRRLQTPVLTQTAFILAKLLL